MLSKAHRESASFAIDPLYSVDEKKPSQLTGEGLWLYGHYECEAFILERMFREKNEARLKVGYTKFRRVPCGKAFFRKYSEKGEKLTLRATGKINVFFNGKSFFEAEPSAGEHTLTFPDRGEIIVFLECDDVSKELPAFWISGKKEEWFYSSDGKEYTSPVFRAARQDGVPPHHAPMEQVDLEPVKIAGNVWDFKTEVLGFVEVVCAAGETPEIYVGESLPEMENRNAEDEEQTREMMCIRPGIFVSKVPLAFRYIQIENAAAPEVKLRAFFHPVAYKGAFSAGEDSEMTRIWMHSAYTLRLCMMNFLLDGIKRDRLPWAGDLAVSLLGNAYSFADRELIRNTLTVLGAVSAKVAHVNTIVDYTLWFIINHDLYQLYFGDREFLQLEYPRISETLDFLLTLRDEQGFLKADGKGGWLFIDWVPGEKITALQMIFVMALRSGAALARRMSDGQRAELLSMEAEKLAACLQEKCFDRQEGIFAAAPGAKEYSRHANLLAVVAGVAEKKMMSSVKNALTGKKLPPVGTPYMSLFEALAVSKCGAPFEALDKIREIWGGMLALGATTFWEGFDPGHSGNEHLVFYERPFGKSLCHAWSAGPLFLLVQLFLGVEPLEDGWTKFRAEPLPHVTASASVPTPWGNIEVEAVDGHIIRLEAPSQCLRMEQ